MKNDKNELYAPFWRIPGNQMWNRVKYGSTPLPALFRHNAVERYRDLILAPIFDPELLAQHDIPEGAIVEIRKAA